MANKSIYISGVRLHQPANYLGNYGQGRLAQLGGDFSQSPQDIQIVKSRGHKSEEWIRSMSNIPKPHSNKSSYKYVSNFQTMSFIPIPLAKDS